MPVRLQTVIIRDRAKFRGSRAYRYRDMGVSATFKMAAVRILGF